jgi:hypothetical protein
VKLYHGTTEAAVNAALNQGILPRNATKVRGNWKHTSNSRPDCTYLTTVYAGYFAGCASMRGRWGIIEVDTDLIPEEFMLPDEDYLEQLERPAPDSPGPAWAALRKANAIKDSKRRMIARTRWFRKHLHVFQDQWENSICDLGNCCVVGGVPAEAITRVSFFEHRSNQYIAHAAMNPMISMLNYAIMREHYQAITNWFMGEPADIRHFGPFFDENHQNKVSEMLKETSGLEVVTIEHKKEKIA